MQITRRAVIPITFLVDNTYSTSFVLFDSCDLRLHTTVRALATFGGMAGQVFICHTYRLSSSESSWNRATLSIATMLCSAPSIGLLVIRLALPSLETNWELPQTPPTSPTSGIRTELSSVIRSLSKAGLSLRFRLLGKKTALRKKEFLVDLFWGAIPSFSLCSKMILKKICK